MTWLILIVVINVAYAGRPPFWPKTWWWFDWDKLEQAKRDTAKQKVWP